MWSGMLYMWSGTWSVVRTHIYYIISINICGVWYYMPMIYVEWDMECGAYTHILHYINNICGHCFPLHIYYWRSNILRHTHITHHTPCPTPHMSYPTPHTIFSLSKQWYLTYGTQILRTTLQVPLHTYYWYIPYIWQSVTCSDRVTWRGGGLGSSTIFKNLMSPTPRRKWYLTTGRRAH